MKKKSKIRQRNNKKYKLLKKGGSIPNAGDIAGAAEGAAEGAAAGAAEDAAGAAADANPLPNSGNSGNPNSNTGTLMAKKAKRKQISTKDPKYHALDTVKNSLLNILGFFAYFTTFMFNAPNSNLETLIPEKDGCKLLFNDELTCRKKIKCFFKKCDVIEDPEGYLLEYKEKQKNQSGGNNEKGDESGNGGNKNSEKRGESETETETENTSENEDKKKNGNEDEPSNYKNKMPLSFRDLLQFSREKYLIFIKKQLNKKLFKPFLLLLKDSQNKNGQKGGNNEGNEGNEGNEDEEEDEDEEETYEIEFIFKQIILDHLDFEDIYKFLILIRMGEKMFGDLDVKIENKKAEIKKFLTSEEAYKILKDQNIYINFPIQSSLFDLAEERVECIMAHFTGITKDQYESNPTLKTCIKSEEKSFIVSAKKVFMKAFNQLTTIYKNTIHSFVNIHYNSLKEFFTFEQLEPEQIMGKYILNLKTLKHQIDITQLFQSVSYKQYEIIKEIQTFQQFSEICDQKKMNEKSPKLGGSESEKYFFLCKDDVNMKEYIKKVGSDYYTYTDALAMLPHFNLKPEVSIDNNDEAILIFKNMYSFFKLINIDKILIVCLMEKLYVNIKNKNISKELKNKRNMCKQILKIHMKEIYDKNLDTKSYGVLLRKVNLDDFSYFSEYEKNIDDPLFLNMLKGEPMSDEDYYEVMKQIPKYSYLLDKDYDKDEFLNQLMKKISLPSKKTGKVKQNRNSDKKDNRK